jgi:hypothetical protein
MLKGCSIPVSTVLHLELGHQRATPDPTVLYPHPVTVVHVCPLDECRIAIVGVAPASEDLHSLAVVENLDEVSVSALFGYRFGPLPTARADQLVHRVLWVAEVSLSRSLGRRAVIAPPAPTMAEGGI